MLSYTEKPAFLESTVQECVRTQPGSVQTWATALGVSSPDEECKYEVPWIGASRKDSDQPLL